MPFELSPENIMVFVVVVAFMFGLVSWLIFSAHLDKQDKAAREAKEINKK